VFRLTVCQKRSSAVVGGAATPSTSTIATLQPHRDDRPPGANPGDPPRGSQRSRAPERRFLDPGSQGGTKGRPSRALNLGQAAALLEAARLYRLHAYVVLSLTTGIRSEEARALRWDHVGLDAGTISAWRSVRAHGDVKTRTSRRTLALAEMAVQALREHQELQRQEPESTSFPHDAWLRPTRCSVTVSVGNLVGGTPAHNVTLGPPLKVPTGTRVPTAFFSHAS
jgi:integrase